MFTIFTSLDLPGPQKSTPPPSRSMTGPDRFHSADTDGDDTVECKLDVRFVPRFYEAKNESKANLSSIHP